MQGNSVEEIASHWVTNLKLANLEHLGGAKLCELLRLLPPLGIDPNCTVSLIKNKDFDQAIRRLDDYFETRVNPAYFMLRFKEMKQLPEESPKQFVLKLKDMAVKCEFVDVKEQVRNQLMWGTHDKQLKRLLAKRKHVDLDEILEEAQLDESFKFLEKMDTEQKIMVPFSCIRDIMIHISINKNVPPVNQPLRRTPLAFESLIEAEITSLLNQDIIEEVQDYSPWQSPIVPILKSQNKIRLYNDMRAANIGHI
uniref:CSON014954 protein n=1 Tax=Culicoides sonorensis TaxID=179676 RepID=A0A336LNK9_CULSO